MSSFNSAVLLFYFISNVLTEKCVSFDFESNYCNVFLPSSPLSKQCVSGRYSINSLVPPNMNSYTDITPITPFPMSIGGTVEISVYSNVSMQFPTLFFSLYVTTENGDIASDILTFEHLGNGWHSMRVTIHRNEKFNGTVCKNKYI